MVLPRLIFGGNNAKQIPSSTQMDAYTMRVHSEGVKDPFQMPCEGTFQAPFWVRHGTTDFETTLCALCTTYPAWARPVLGM